MTTDRVLLELAAKAAGLRWDHLTDCWYDSERDYLDWNPLHFDGDALRLAVKLKLTMQQNFAGVFCYDNPDFADKSQAMIEAYESTRSDPCAATRRAIVRVAAEVGRSME